MVSLIVAAVCFLGIHIFVSGTRLRDVIVGRIGERSYLAIFSLGSLGIIIWMSGAYGAAPYLKLWSAGAASRHIAFALMLPAVFLVVTGLATRNPTATGGAPLLERERAAVGIMTVTRHPFMWGIVIWSLAHLLANGDIEISQYATRVDCEYARAAVLQVAGELVERARCVSSLSGAG